MCSAPKNDAEFTKNDAVFTPPSSRSSSIYYSCNLPQDLENTEAIATTTDRFDEEYDMNHTRRGIALIFNHEYYCDKNNEQRSGTNKDCKDLKNCLKDLGFDVIVCKDFLYKQIENKISWAAELDHTDNDCILIAIMSHGEKGGYIHAKDVRYKVDDLCKHFTSDKCPTLAGKPKIFFVQACRGNQAERRMKMKRSITQCDGRASGYYKIPLHADFLMAYSTIPGFYSWRSASKGSWFMQSLCKELTINGKSYDILTLLTFVSQRVAIDFETYSSDEKNNKTKQIPCVVSMLTRLLYFRDKTNYDCGLPNKHF